MLLKLKTTFVLLFLLALVILGLSAMDQYFTELPNHVSQIESSVAFLSLL